MFERQKCTKKPIDRAIMSYSVREKGRKRREKQTGKKNAARKVFSSQPQSFKDIFKKKLFYLMRSS